MKINSFIAVLTLATAAGTTLTAKAQTQTQPSRTTINAPAATVMPMDLRPCKWLSGRDVYNSAGKEIANTTDLVLDRGSGRVEYLIIKTGQTLGMGGHTIAVPYEQFSWDAAKERFILSSTVDQLKSSPRFSTEGWTGLMTPRSSDKAMADNVPGNDSNSPNKNASPTDPNNPARANDNPDDYTAWNRMSRAGSYTADPYKGHYDTTKAEQIEGEVTKVERKNSGEFGEQVFITVKTADGSQRRVAVGPSWFIGGGNVTPMRGDKVVVGTYVLPKDPDKLSTASRMRVGDRELRLRDDSGNPIWSGNSYESSGQNYSTPYYRYILASKLDGAKVDCRGVESGKVNDIIIDRANGRAAFLSIDPNENFLGIADTKRLVPWSVATVSLDGTVRIDANKDMVLASPETPSDFSKSNSSGIPDMVYKSYDVPAPMYEPMNRRSDLTPMNPGNQPNANTPGTRDEWKSDGMVLSAIDTTTASTLTGKIVDHTDVSFTNSVSPAKAVTISVQGGSNETILLGPVAYIDRNKPKCNPGDTVTLNVYRTTIDGKRYWIARSLETNGNKMNLLDGSNRPVWSDK